MKMIIASFVVLSLVAFFFWQKEDQQVARQTMSDWSVIDENKVARISIKAASDSEVVFQYTEQSWVFLDDGSAADGEAIARLLSDLTQMKAVRVVTRTRKHDDDLGFTARSVQLKLSDAAGKVLLDVSVGKQGANLISTYVRLRGEDSVLAVNKALTWQIHRSRDAWKKKDAIPDKTPAIVDGYSNNL